MPNMDKTGPMGTGPMGLCRGGCERKLPSDFVGRRRGFGNIYDVKPSRSRARRVVKGRSSGYGFGLEYGFSDDNEKIYLENSIETHQEVIDELKARLEELERKK